MGALSVFLNSQIKQETDEIRKPSSLTTDGCQPTAIKKMKEQLTHFDEKGNTRMVDVGSKDETLRIAIACGHITARPETLRLIAEQGMEEGRCFRGRTACRDHGGETHG